LALDDGEGVQHDCNISVESRTNAGVSNGHADTHSASRALAAVNAQLAEATAFRDAAQQAHDRLAKPAALLDEAAREYTGEKARHDAAITTWYEGGCPGERPELPSRMIELERELGDLRRDIGAVGEHALGASGEAVHAANEELASLHLRQRSALYGAAVEACERRLHAKAIPALVAALNEFSIVESLEVELRNRGFGPDPHPEALSASRQIGRLITIARQSTGVRGNLELARQFLEELGANPDAELPDPGEPLVEHIKPRIEKPMPDASEFINRGNREPEAPQPFQPAMPNPATDPDEAWWRFNGPQWAQPPG
jgi:hypothetical protein